MAISISVDAQLSYKVVQDIPVFQDNVKLKYPWVGGLNSPQINTMDLNADGTNDLVLFDRFANKIYTFIAENNDFTYAPEWERQFPEALNYWVLLRDFNGDGKKDIFSGHWQGVVVYVNTSTQMGQFSWRPFNQGNSILTTDLTGVSINLPVNPADIPVIDDIDQDGDLDFLSAHIFAFTRIEFNRNQSLVRNQNKDSLQFTRETIQWGNLFDCACGQFDFTGNFCRGGRINHAGGKALLTYDVDDDGDLDLFYSDEFCDNVYLLRNLGDGQNPIFQSAESILSTPQPFFPAVYASDIDSNGKLDLLISSNQAERSTITTNFSTSVWKLGTEFSVIQQNFLQQNMIDVGDNAVPAFADYDYDGDLDMIIGNYSDGENGNIWFYENRGLTFQPEFHLVDRDFLGLSSQQLTDIKPLFVDITGDGRQDLVLTAFSRLISNFGVFYLENKSNAGFDFSTSALQTIPFNIWNEKITISDYNGDGKKDIIKSNFRGGIELWLNENGQYVQSNALDYLGENFGRLSPFLCVSDVDADGTEDLIISGSQGQISIVRNYTKGTSEEELISIHNPATDTYEYSSLGGRLFVTAVRLTNPSRPQLVAGTSRGGLIFLEPVIENRISAFDLFPNPVQQSNKVFAKSSEAGTVTVYSATGKISLPSREIDANAFLEIDVSDLPPAIYLVRLKTSKRVKTKRLIIKHE